LYSYSTKYGIYFIEYEEVSLLWGGKIIILNKEDNVATVLKDLLKDEVIDIEEYGLKINIQEDIPFGHKFAIKDIKKGKAIIKYGEIIGVAVKDISKGEHVHTHNVISNRGRGDII